MCGSIRARTLSKLLKAMRPRRAVPKTPAKISVSLGLPLNKSRSLLTHSESTLPQPLIPLHFNSRRCNVYRKPGEGAAVLAPKFCNSSLPACGPSPRARTPVYPERPSRGATLFRSYIYCITRGQPGVGVSLSGTAKLFAITRVSRDESWLSLFDLSRVTVHGTRPTNQGPRPHWSPGTVAPQPTKCQNHASCPGWHPGQETYPLPSVSNLLRADIGHGKLQRRPGSKSIPERRAGIALARRPGSNVLRCSSNVDLSAGWSG